MTQLHFPETDFSNHQCGWERRHRSERGNPAVLIAFSCSLISIAAAIPDASVYLTSLSNLWRGSESLRFRTTYAGGTVLEGFICSDLIEIGGYGLLAPFGCITSKSGVLDGEGIAGFGPAPARTAGAPPPLPPFFLSLANVTGDHGPEGTPVPHPSFTFLTSDSAAELQLGGMDPAAVQGEVYHVTSLDAHTYSIPVRALSLGGRALLSFRNTSLSQTIPAVLDSGTTCMCLPDSLRGGQLSASPYHTLTSLLAASLPDAPLSILIDGGPSIDIPSAVWHQDVQHIKGCLSTNCPQDRIVLGDWFFRSAVVMFQWATHPVLRNPPAAADSAAPPPSSYLPRIAIAQRQPSYRLHPPLEPATLAGAVQRHHVVRKVSLVDEDRLTFLVPTDIGKPAQRFHLVFDTGSSFFGVNTRPLRTADKKLEEEEHSLEERKEEARQRVLKLSDAMHRSEQSHRAGNGPPWWAGVLVALIGVCFFMLALGMALARRRMQRGGGATNPSSLKAFATPG